MTDLLDEINAPHRLRTALAVIGGLLLLSMGAVKVRNELKMTEAYDRQAVALERIANGMRDGLYITNDSHHFLKAWAFEQKREAAQPSRPVIVCDNEVGKPRRDYVEGVGCVERQEKRKWSKADMEPRGRWISRAAACEAMNNMPEACSR